MPPYRVQEYLLDMGVYHKQQVLDGVSHKEYCNRNVFYGGFYIILPSDDPMGKALPQTVLGYDERSELCRTYENKDAEATP